MIHFDESALICDLAEVYHIYNYRSLPVFLVATLAAGLGDNSRIKMKMRGELVTREVLMLSVIADRLGVLIAGLSGEEKAPQSFIDLIYGEDGNEISKSDVQAFITPEDFEKAREKILKGAINNEE